MSEFVFQSQQSKKLWRISGGGVVGASLGQLFFVTSMAQKIHYLKLEEEKVLNIVTLHVHQHVWLECGNW